MDTLAFNIADKVLCRLASRAYQEISSALSVKVELDKLKKTLETIILVLQDAERKQTTNPLITHWLRKLNDVCLDADDVLADFEYQKLRMQVVNRSVKGKVCNFFSHRNSLSICNKISHKIKILDKGYIDGEKNKYSLVERDAGGDSPGVHKEVRDETSSHVQMSDVIGRDFEAKQIIGKLLVENREGEDNVSVISIVGLGGLGKTTLAKFVYNNKRVVEEFELKMWVCVSDEFLNKRLICEVINLATGQKCDTTESLQQMQLKLQNGLQGKKFLLVLDDVWDKEQVGVTIKKWDEFKILLNIGSRGSKIIITTRSENVAIFTCSTHVHKLKVLAHEDCMSLFKRMAFIKRDEEQHNQHLMEIAEDIVKKCGGVPLALATVGSALRWKRDIHDWMQVRDNDIWKEEGILLALKLSYDALPRYMKPCFAYCSLFPKDHVFYSVDLVSLWMAEGYLQSSNRKQGFEEIGIDNIRQFCSRSLFQNVSDSSCANIFVKFKMHDLVHDLAYLVALIERSSMNGCPVVASKRVRYVSLSPKDLSVEEEHVRESTVQLHKVRTIVIPEWEITTLSKSLFFKRRISRFEYLRVLDLCKGDTKLHWQLKPLEIPKSIWSLDKEAS